MTDFDAIEPASQATPPKGSKLFKLLRIVIINAAVATYFVFATLKYIDRRKIYRDRFTLHKLKLSMKTNLQGIDAW